MIEEFCRLCAQPRKQTIDLFGNEISRHLVHFKIVHTLNIVVSERDPLTKHVCVLCVGKLDFVWNFTNDCQKAQTILRKTLAESHTNEEFEISRQLTQSLLTCESDHDNTTAGGLTISCDGQLLQCLRERPLTSGNTENARLNAELYDDLYSSVNKDIQIFEETGTDARCFTPNVERAEIDDAISLSLSLTCEDETPNLETYVGNKMNRPSPSNRDNTSFLKVIAPFVRTKKTNSNSTTAQLKCPVVVISEETSQNVAVEKVTDTLLNSELRADESELGTRKVCDFQTENSPAFATETTKSLSIPSTSSENNANVAQVGDTGDRILGTAAGDSKKANEILHSVFEKDDDDDEGSEDDDDKTDGSSANDDDNCDGTDGSTAKVEDDTCKNKMWHFVPKATAKEKDSDLLNNRIPWLKVVKEEKKNSKILYIVNPDVVNLKDGQDFKMMPEVGLYLRYRESNFTSNSFQAILPVLIENLIKGKCSMMPYYTQWSHFKEGKKFGMKCPFCKKIFSKGRQELVNHLNDHLHFNCPDCNVFLSSANSARRHLSSTLRHNVLPQLVCAKCRESFGGGDFDRYLHHVRGHYDGYSCAMCDFSTGKRGEWLKHLKVERNNANCHSFDCSLFYEDVDSLFRHVSNIAKVGGYVCGACGLPFHSEEHLLWHLDIYGLQHGKKSLEEENMADLESNESELYQLKDFSKTISTFNKILEQELPLENFKCAYTVAGSGIRKGFKCVYCSKRVYSERTFIRHIQNHLMHCCYKCRKIYKSTGQFKQHSIKKNCFTSRSCLLCDGNVMLNNLESYLEHASHHAKKVICIYCQQIMTNNSKLANHIIRFHYEKHYNEAERTACEICGVVVKRSSLKMHIKEQHTGTETKRRKTHLCDTCGKSFKSPRRFNVHKIKTHKLEKESERAEQYMCSYCDKRFYFKYHLQEHILVHLNERTFECDMCHKRFNRRAHLGKHNKDVHSEKKWKCQLCPCAYSYRSALVTHRLNSHS